MAVTRRVFLKSSGLAMVSFAAAPSFLRLAVGGTLTVGGKDTPIIIAIFQRGAADGISMVAPFGDQSYYLGRPQIAIPHPKADSVDSAIDLDGFFGLHPALAAFKQIYNAGHLAIVHAVGSPDNTRSHFDAQDYMESGTPGRKSTPDGWLNRYLGSKRIAKPSPFRAVAFSSNLPRTLMGGQPALAMTTISEFGVRGDGGAARGFEALYASDSKDLLGGAGSEAFEAVKLLRRVNPQQYKPATGIAYPPSRYGQALMQTAQLIKANIGLEAAFTDIGGWDTHANQGGSRGQLANRLREFSQGIAALYYDLGDRMNNVVILTMTEFGRTIRQNGSGGTDHGHASALFVIGGSVKGGKVYGKWPGLAPEKLYEGRDLALTTDFRDVFAEVASRHLRAANVAAIFPGHALDRRDFPGVMKG